MKKITHSEELKLSSIHDQLCALRNKILKRRKIEGASGHDPVSYIDQAINKLDQTFVSSFD